MGGFSDVILGLVFAGLLHVTINVGFKKAAKALFRMLRAGIRAIFEPWHRTRQRQARINRQQQARILEGLPPLENPDLA
jgi:hypothetical protein